MQQFEQQRKPNCISIADHCWCSGWLLMFKVHCQNMQILMSKSH